MAAGPLQRELYVDWVAQSRSNRGSACGKFFFGSRIDTLWRGNSHSFQGVHGPDSPFFRQFDMSFSRINHGLSLVNKLSRLSSEAGCSELPKGFG